MKKLMVYSERDEELMTITHAPFGYIVISNRTSLVNMAYSWLLNGVHFTYLQTDSSLFDMSDEPYPKTVSVNAGPHDKNLLDAIYLYLTTRAIGKCELVEV